MQQNFYFDQISSFSRTHTQAAICERFRRAGFRIETEDQDASIGGVRSSYIEFAGSRLEIVTVENEDEFLASGEEWLHAVRQDPRPFRVGSRTADVRRVVASLAPRETPDHDLLQKRDAAQPIVVRRGVMKIPQSATPGVSVFAVRQRDTDEQIGGSTSGFGSNTIYALGGFEFCTRDTRAHRNAWLTTLAAIAPVHAPDETSIQIGFQKLSWIDPSSYYSLYGKYWNEIRRNAGELCAVRLFAEDTRTAIDKIIGAGWTIAGIGPGQGVRFAPDSDTGLAFILESRVRNT